VNLVHSKTITCVLPKGTADTAIFKLKQEKGIVSAMVSHAREAMGMREERDILTVAVPKDKADDIFNFLYELCEINRPGKGLLFMATKVQAVPFQLPDLPDEPS